MSDYFGIGKLGSSFFGSNDPFGLNGQPDTLAPFVEQQKQAAKNKISLLQPVKWIFDILSRGQYLTADVGESIIKSVRTGEPLGQAAQDALTAALAGITGRVKGDWQNVLFGGKNEGEDKSFEGLFPDTKLPTWAKKVIGFVADVALDPTSYISFGATGAARSVAKNAAEEATRIAIKELGEGGKLIGAMQKGLDVARVEELAAKGSFEELSKIVSKSSPDISKYLNDIYKNTFSQALRMPAEDIQKMLAERAGKASELSPQIAESLAPLMERLKTGFGAGAGTVGFKLGPFGIGQDVGIKPASQSMAIRAWDTVSNMFKNSPVGEGLDKAWWAINNHGPLKAIRDAFGIRTGNPVSQWAHDLMLSKGDRTRAWTGQAMKEAFQVGQEVSPELQKPLMDAYMIAESFKKAIPEEGALAEIDAIIKNPTMVRNIIEQSPKIANDQRRYLLSMIDDLASTVTQGGSDNLIRAAESLKGLTESWTMTTKEAVAKGIFPKEHYMEDYLPNLYKNPQDFAAMKGAGTGFNQSRKFTKTQATTQEINWFQHLFNLDQETAARLVRKNHLGSLVTDLPSMLVYRAQAEARLRSRIALVDDLKQFAIPEKEIDFALKQGVLRDTKEFGRVAGAEYDGLLFPRDVAEVVNKVNDITKDPGLRGFMKLWGGFTTWWRGFSTLSGGFHVRNFIQDNFTDYLHHGVTAFNPTTYKDALVGTIYALAKDNPAPMLEKVGMKLFDYNKILAKKYGELSVQEMADYGLREGLISQFGRAFDAQTYGKMGLSANPVAKNFAPTALSRKLEEIMSNTDRMKFFLNEFTNTSKMTPVDMVEKLAEYAPSDTIADYQKFIDSPRFQKHKADLNYSMLETKKWLFDYADLSPFEQKIMKNIFPFYTWLRKNIPAQLATITTNPSIYALIPKGEEAISSGVDVPPEAIPDWLRALGAIPISKDAQGNPTFWSPNLGYEDLNKIPLLFGPNGIPKMELTNLKDDLMQIAHPLIKDVVQLIPEKGYDVFYKRDLNYKAPAPYLMQYFLAVPGMMQVTDGLLRIAGVDKGLGAVKDDQGQIRIDAKIAKVLEDNLPILRVIERTMGAGASAIPGLDEAVGHVKQDDPIKMTSQFFKLLSFYGGLKFNTYDVEQEKQRYASNILAEAQAAKTLQGKYTPMAKIRTAKYQTQQQRRAAKYGL
jgi:hypothetical protein